MPAPLAILEMRKMVPAKGNWIVPKGEKVPWKKLSKSELFFFSVIGFTTKMIAKRTRRKIRTAPKGESNISLRISMGP
jgi:hypothetical protein